ncbi:MAG: hypothetical protein HYU28_11480 [Actinobacteria bacterium]|nr:hypothetical protein [Actinomycetota bacterium]
MAHPPAEGVYVYATTGFETVDALGGARHDYPAETTVTFTYDGDLVRGRWDVLEERWDESVVKRTDLGVEYVRHTAYHEFFGQADRRDLDCEPGSLAIPEDMTPGFSFTMHCNAGETHSSCEARVLGMEPVTVGGSTVQAVHTLMTTTASGDVRGTMVREYWSLPENGLTLKAKVTTDTESDAPMGAGTFNYHEEYDLTLKSLQPLS